MVGPLPGSEPNPWQRSQASSARHLDVGAHAEQRFLERYFQIVAHVFAALRARPPASARAKKVAETEEIAQDVAEIGELAGIETSARRALQTGVAVAVIGRPLLRVAQDAVRLGGFLEAVLGARIVRVAVRVIFEGQLAVSALDILFPGLPAKTENLVIISF